MVLPPTEGSAPRKPLRLWPGVVVVTAQWLARFVVPAVFPDAMAVGFIGVLAGGLALVLWWLFFSRAPWIDRLAAIVLMAVGLVATRPILHESIATGARGMLFPILAVPGLSLAFVAWAAAARRLRVGPRLATMAGAILLACAAWALARTGGFTGNFDNDLAWRWSETPEERLLAQVAHETAGPPAALPPAGTSRTGDAESRAEPAPTAPGGAEARAEGAGGTEAAPAGAGPEAAPAAAREEAPPARAGHEAAPATGRHEAPPAAGPTKPAVAAAAPSAATTSGPAWPGFRGPRRDGIVAGVRIRTDWSASPPVELWRRPVGPGWSSFAVQGGRFYTQEQRGDDEVVACYDVSNGEPVWMHRDRARFWESNGGAGPRATPTLHDGRVYALGATGILNALDAATGAVVWSRNAATDTGAKLPGWGFSGSPLVVDDVVIIAASGALAGYDRASGRRRWVDPPRGGSYSSPHPATLAGTPQVLLLSGTGATSVAPADGKLLWEHSWPGSTIVQPAVIGERDVLVTTSGASGGIGIRRLAVANGPSGWAAEERWTSIGLKPYFNDFVVHDGHVYGFDGSLLACIDLESGARRWKGGRYGNGQLVLLPEQDLLLVVSEEGELALVGATPERFTEIARTPGIEGKTWNHPVVVGDVLLVRNAEQMAAFRLSGAGR